MKKSFIFLVIVSIVLITVFLSFPITTGRVLPQDKLVLVFCDVGQADATLIQFGTKQVVIDVGRDAEALKCLQEFMPSNDLVIDVLVATHADADHIGGLKHVLSQYSIELLLWNGLKKETAEFDYFNEFLSGNVQSRVAKQGDILQINQEIQFHVLAPTDLRKESSFNDQLSEVTLSAQSPQSAGKEIDHNEYSVILLMEYKSFSAIFSGDASSEVELALTRRGLIKDVVVLKAGHHGSKTSSSAHFLDVAQPEVSIISSGRGNSYGHPHDEVIQRISDSGSYIHRTDEQGSLILVSDGVHLGVVRSHSQLLSTIPLSKNNNKRQYK